MRGREPTPIRLPYSPSSSSLAGSPGAQRRAREARSPSMGVGDCLSMFHPGKLSLQSLPGPGFSASRRKEDKGKKTSGSLSPFWPGPWSRIASWHMSPIICPALERAYRALYAIIIRDIVTITLAVQSSRAHSAPHCVKGSGRAGDLSPVPQGPPRSPAPGKAPSQNSLGCLETAALCCQFAFRMDGPRPHSHPRPRCSVHL